MTTNIRRRSILAPMLLPCLFFASCADRDGDGERRKNVTSDMALPMKAGIWETRVEFAELDVRNLGEQREKKIIAEMEAQASGKSCLNEKQAAKPAASFFVGRKAKDCKYRSYAENGANSEITISCEMDGMAMIDTSLKGPIGENDFAMDVDMELRLPIVGKVELKGKATGEYKGICPGAE